MATLRATIRTTLEGDATLTALLTGGVFDDSELDREGMSFDDVPKTGNVVNPFAVIRWGDTTGDTSHRFVAPENEMIQIHVYQSKGYAIIEQAISRIKTLLHNQYFDADDRTFTHCLFIGGSSDLPAQELHNIPRRFVRYQIIGTRS